MIKIIKYIFGATLLVSMLTSCTLSDVRIDDTSEDSFDSDQRYADLQEEISQKSDELSDEIDQMIENYSELEGKVKEQTKELETQRRLLTLLPQSWQAAEKFLEAYVDLDYDVLDELTTDDYSIEEEGIVFSEFSTHTPYLSLRYAELDYLLNNFDLAPDVSPDQVRMNVSFYLINSDSDIENIEYMNLHLEKINEIWQVTQVEF